MSLQNGLGGAAAILERVGVLFSSPRGYKEGFNEHDESYKGPKPFKVGNEHDQEGVGQLPYKTSDDHGGKGPQSLSYKTNIDTDKVHGLGAFMSQMQQEGFVRKNYFFVDILSPRLAGGQLNRKASLLCESTTMPGYQIATGQQMISGYQYEVPYGIVFPDVRMTFYVDGHADVKGFFDNWLLKVFPDGERWDLNYADEYLSTIAISQVHNIRKGSNNEKVAYAVELFEAFPKSVGDLQYLQGSNGEIHTIDVTFTYKKWNRTVIGSKAAENNGGAVVQEYNIGAPKTTS